MPDETFTEQQTLRIAGQAEWLITSDLGKYLISKSQDEALAAIEEIFEADPEDPKLIRKLQNKKLIPEKALEWIFGIIQEADQLEELRESEDTPSTE
jgi:hypothetical protein